MLVVIFIVDMQAGEKVKRMPKYIIDIPEDRVTSDGKLRFMACIDSPLANWIYTGIFAEPFDRKAIEDEVWKFAKKIGSFNGLTKNELDECFGHTTIQGVMTTYDTYQEAKREYEKWKKSKDEIHVGDEVRDNDLDDIGVVTYVDDSCYCILWSSGVVSEDVPLGELHKTGRHFDDIADLLKKMKEQ